MEFLVAIILGIIQGLTEFFPVSSSAHLLLLHEVLNWKGHDELAFDVALHAGTTLAIVIFFAKDFRAIFCSYFKKETDTNSARLRKLGWAILVSCLPAGILGVFFKDQIETVLRAPILTGINLLVFGLILYVADHRSKGEKGIADMSLWDALFIGLFQALAPIPGVSRSGITITGGLLKGYRRDEAARFSFLMVTPLVIGATFIKFYDLFSDPLKWDNFVGSEWSIYLVGTIISFITGILCIKYFLRFLKKFPLDIFVIYRCILGIFVLFFFLDV